jgi:hypothetical protein
MEPRTPWGHGPLEPDAYLANRAALLNKLLLDHAVWAESLAAYGEGASLTATWVDLDGQLQTTAINQPFLDAHLTILRSLMQDLTAFGPEGYLCIRAIFRAYFALAHETDALHERSMEATMSNTDVAPHQPIRRFDVFAEYTRQERREKGYPEDEAKGYGIWLAKVVASRRFGQKAAADGKKPRQQDERDREEEPKFRSVGDELQTDETFDHDIIDRMGARFYDEVLVPAITEARAAGKSYETIRDTIRKGWKPSRAASR